MTIIVTTLRYDTFSSTCVGLVVLQILTGVL